MLDLITKLTRYIKKFHIWTRIIIVIIIAFVVSYVYSILSKPKQIEGFTQKEKFIVKENSNIYDPFYVSIYDSLVYDPVKNNFEIGELVRTTGMEPAKSIVLDIGSGTGHHVKMLHDKGISVHGIDTSPAMIHYSKKNYPELNFTNGDALDTMMFPANTFTHINSLYFTIYYIQDKRKFFENCYHWLKPGGYVSIHLVNRDKFNPIINVADPLIMVSPQKYAKQRITNSSVKFDTFQYKANFNSKPEKNIGLFEETFKDDATHNVRKNKHTFYMDTQKNILAKAKEVGFILKGKLDMVYCKYEYQYIYILYKPE